MGGRALFPRSDLGLVGLSLGFPRQAAGHGVDLALAARHAVEDVDVEVLLDDVPDLVVLTLLQVPLEQLVGVARDAQHKLAGAEVQQCLVASHVLSLGEAGQDAQVVLIVTLLVAAEPWGGGKIEGAVTASVQLFRLQDNLEGGKARAYFLKKALASFSWVLYTSSRYMCTNSG